MGIVERKVREKERRRKQILKAGEKIFLRRGVDNTTMEEIARSCELSKGTIYLYFKNKEELFTTIMMDALDIFIGMLEKNLTECQTVDDKLNMIWKTYLEFCRDKREYFQLMNSHSMGSHARFKIDITDKNLAFLSQTQKLFSVITDVLEEGQQVGVIRKDLDLMEFVVVFWSASNGVMAFMDHLASHDTEIIPELMANYPQFGYLSRFAQLNHERSLTMLWNMIGDAIKPQTREK